MIIVYYTYMLINIIIVYMAIYVILYINICDYQLCYWSLILREYVHMTMNLSIHVQLYCVSMYNCICNLEIPAYLTNVFGDISGYSMGSPETSVDFLELLRLF
jgi:hypothetical protein